MVFSIDTVKNANKSLSFLEETEEDHDLFFETLELCLQEDASLLQIFDEGILNSLITDKEVEDIKERIKSFDPTTIFEKIFDWFIMSLAKLFAAFKGVVMQILMGANTDLRRYRKELENFREEIKYTKGYYDYQHLELDSSTALEFRDSIQGVYDMFTKELEKVPTLKSKEQIEAYLKQELEKDYDLDSVRGKTIGINSVNSEDFSNMLFTYFRTTDRPKKNRNGIFTKDLVQPERLHQAFVDYQRGPKQISMIEREQFKYKAEANAMKAKIKGINIANMIKNGSTLNPEIITTYNRLSSKRCKEVKAICDIFLMFLSSKMQAIKEYNVTNKNLLLIACRKITANKALKQ